MTIDVIVGTFDMFHIGHLNLCINAKSHCDYLIAGVNKDAVVQRDKNIIPTINEKDRLQIIKYISCVQEAHLVDGNASYNVVKLIKGLM